MASASKKSGDHSEEKETALCAVFLQAAERAFFRKPWPEAELRATIHAWASSGCLCWRLVNAAGRGDVAGVAACLEDIAAEGHEGRRCADVTCGHHTCSAIRSVSFLRTPPLNPLAAAVQHGHVRVVEQLVTAGHVPRRLSDPCPIVVACKLGHRDMIKLLYHILPQCECGSPATRDDCGSPLAIVASSELPDADACALLRFIVKELSVNVDHVGADGQTAVLAAIRAGRTAVWRFLLQELGAVVDVHPLGCEIGCAPTSGAVALALGHYRFDAATALINEFHARIPKPSASEVLRLRRKHVTIPRTTFDSAIADPELADSGNRSRRRQFHAFLRAIAPRLDAEFKRHLVMRALTVHIYDLSSQWELLRTLVEDLRAPLRTTAHGEHSLLLHVLAVHSMPTMPTWQYDYGDMVLLLRFLLEHGADPNDEETWDAGYDAYVKRPFGFLLLRDAFPEGANLPEWQRRIGELFFQHGFDFALPVIRTWGGDLHNARSYAARHGASHVLSMLDAMQPPLPTRHLDALLYRAVMAARVTLRPREPIFIPVATATVLTTLLHAGGCPNDAGGRAASRTANVIKAGDQRLRAMGAGYTLTAALSHARGWRTRSALLCIRAQRAAHNEVASFRVDEQLFRAGCCLQSHRDF